MYQDSTHAKLVHLPIKEARPGAYPGGMHWMHVHPPPPQPERLVMRKDEAVGNKKKTIKIFLKSIKIFQFRKIEK
jgi:hypothetical protein